MLMKTSIRSGGCAYNDVDTADCKKIKKHAFDVVYKRSRDVMKSEHVANQIMNGCWQACRYTPWT